MRFKDKKGHGDDDEVTVFGLNAGRGEVIYNPSLVELAFFGAGDMPPPGFDDAVGIAADADGLVVVGDRGNDRVVVLRVDENTRLRYVSSITLGNTDTPLSGPAGVAIAGGLVYVADGGNDRVVVCDTAGVVRTEYVAAGLRAPFDVDAVEKQNFLVVTDMDGQRLTRIDLDGATHRSVAYSEVTGGNGGFGYVAIDYYGSIFVSDTDNGCVYKFRDDLLLLSRFECEGDERDELDDPRGIGIHRRLGQVFVAENTGVSYYWIGTDVTGLRAVMGGRGERLRLDVRFVLSERSLVTVELETGDGEAVVTLAHDVAMEAGRENRSYTVERSDLPCDVANCKYRVTVRARATYASKKHLEVSRTVPVR